MQFDQPYNPEYVEPLKQNCTTITPIDQQPSSQDKIIEQEIEPHAPEQSLNQNYNNEEAQQEQLDQNQQIDQNVQPQQNYEIQNFQDKQANNLNQDVQQNNHQFEQQIDDFFQVINEEQQNQENQQDLEVKKENMKLSNDQINIQVENSQLNQQYQQDKQEQTPINNPQQNQNQSISNEQNQQQEQEIKQDSQQLQQQQIVENVDIQIPECDNKVKQQQTSQDVNQINLENIQQQDINQNEKDQEINNNQQYKIQEVMKEPTPQSAVSDCTQDKSSSIVVKNEQTVIQTQKLINVYQQKLIDLEQQNNGFIIKQEHLEQAYQGNYTVVRQSFNDDSWTLLSINDVKKNFGSIQLFLGNPEPIFTSFQDGYQVFNFFFPDNLMGTVTLQANQYLQSMIKQQMNLQKKPNDFLDEEVRAFFGLKIAMGLRQSSNVKEFFSQELIHTVNITQLFNEKRFLFLIEMEDEVCKLLQQNQFQVLNDFNKLLNMAISPDQNLVLYRKKSNAPPKDQFYEYILCESQSGFIINYFIGDRNFLLEQEKLKKILSSQLFVGKSYKLFFQQNTLTLQTIQNLLGIGIHFTGFLNNSDTCIPETIRNFQLQKQATYFRSQELVLEVKYNKKKREKEYFITTWGHFSDNEQNNQINIIQEYLNQFKLGLTFQNQYDKNSFKNRQQSFLEDLMEISLFNSFVLYVRIGKYSNQTYREFRAYISKCLLSERIKKYTQKEQENKLSNLIDKQCQTEGRLPNKLAEESKDLKNKVKKDISIDSSDDVQMIPQRNNGIQNHNKIDSNKNQSFQKTPISKLMDQQQTQKKKIRQRDHIRIEHENEDFCVNCDKQKRKRKTRFSCDACDSENSNVALYMCKDCFFDKHKDLEQTNGINSKRTFSSAFQDNTEKPNKILKPINDNKFHISSNENKFDDNLQRIIDEKIEERLKNINKNYPPLPGMFNSNKQKSSLTKQNILQFKNPKQGARSEAVSIINKSPLPNFKHPLSGDEDLSSLNSKDIDLNEYNRPYIQRQQIQQSQQYQRPMIPQPRKRGRPRLMCAQYASTLRQQKELLLKKNQRNEKQMLLHRGQFLTNRRQNISYDDSDDEDLEQIENKKRMIKEFAGLH